MSLNLLPFTLRLLKYKIIKKTLNILHRVVLKKKKNLLHLGNKMIIRNIYCRVNNSLIKNTCEFYYYKHFQDCQCWANVVSCLHFGRFSGGLFQNWYKSVMNSHLFYIPDFSFLEYQIFLLYTLQLIKRSQFNFKEYMPNISHDLWCSPYTRLNCDLRTD